MITKFQTSSTVPTTDDVYQFLVRTCMFQLKGRECEKKYSLGRDSRDCLLVVLRYMPEQGLFAKWELSGQAGQHLFIEPSGKTTKSMNDFSKWTDNLAKASALIHSDMTAIEKFLRG